MNESILEEAARIVNGDRAKDYGDSNEMLERIADLWEPVLRDCISLDSDGEPYLYLNPRHVALCLIQLKVAREAHSPKRDNAVDIAGYAEILGRASEAECGAGYSSGQNFDGAPEPMGLEVFRDAIHAIRNSFSDASKAWSFYAYLNKLAIAAGWSKLVDDCPPQDREEFVRRLETSASLIATGYKPETMEYLGPGKGFSVTWLWEAKTDLQNEKTDSENPKCQATDPKSEATPRFKSGGRIMGETPEPKTDSATPEPSASYSTTKATSMFKPGDRVRYQGEEWTIKCFKNLKFRRQFAVLVGVGCGWDEDWTPPKTINVDLSKLTSAAETKSEAPRAFKKGDKVRVLRKAESYENGWDNEWMPGMDAAIGRVWTVNRDTGPAGVELYFAIDELSGFSFPAYVLELVSEGED